MSDRDAWLWTRSCIYAAEQFAEAYDLGGVEFAVVLGVAFSKQWLDE